VSGVRQSSISQFLSGKVNLSDEQLDRLLSGMGYRLEVVRRPVMPELTRSERRCWRLHRQLSTHLTRSSLKEWRQRIERNLTRLRGGVSGQPHLRNLDRWETLVEREDVPGLHRVLTGLGRDFVAALLDAGLVNSGVIAERLPVVPDRYRPAVERARSWIDARLASPPGHLSQLGFPQPAVSTPQDL
jgi:hypothetical protein